MSSPITSDTLDRLNRTCFSPLDRQFATLVCGNKQEPPAVYAAAALASRCRHYGHTCLDFRQIHRFSALLENTEIFHAEKLSWPSPEEWINELRASPAIIGRPGERAPLILDERHRLYLYRYWRMEQDLAAKIHSLQACSVAGLTSALIAAGLEMFFPSTPESDPAQRSAAYLACHRVLCIISGGPGAGKTTTIAKIVALFSHLQTGKKWRVGVTALTGKAAHRLQEAIGGFWHLQGEKGAPVFDLPPPACTLHKLLGYNPQSQQFRYHQDNPLPYHLVIVDEASMINLLLMVKLVAALPAGGRLILVGDKDQLASVEPGAVFADLCQASPWLSPVSSALGASHDDVSVLDTGAGSAPVSRTDRYHGYGVALLKKSYRFSTSGDIHLLSQLVLAGDEEGAWKLVTNAGVNPGREVHCHPLPMWPIADDFFTALLPALTAYLDGDTHEKIFSRYSQCKILTPFRVGPYGTISLNAAIERRAQELHLLESRGKWYYGRPIIITKNDAHTQLFNGDAGLILNAPGGERLYAYFSDPHHGYRSFLPSRLPEHETCFALTVNKAQGSEYDAVHLLVPEASGNLLTRELLYTGITRARRRLTLHTNEAAFKQALRNRTLRFSGLADSLTAVAVAGEPARN